MVATKTVTAWLLSLLATQSLAAVQDMLSSAPSGWVSSPVDDSQPITLQIALAEKNIDQLEDKLMSVSDPKSGEYGNHFSKEDVDGLFPPVDGAVDAVTSWLKDNGVTKVHTDGSFINIHTDVGTANKLLDTSFARYSQDGVSKVRTTQYSVPDDVSQYVDLIHPTTYFGKPRPNMPTTHYSARDELAERSGEVDASCSQSITPSCIKQLYNINYKPKPSSGSKIGFGSFLNQTARVKDLQMFLNQYKVAPQNFTNVLINGGKDDQGIDNNHGEADLDVELIVSTAGPLPVTQFITGGSPPFIPDINEPTDNQNEPYLQYYQYLLSQPADKLPQVISNSYGDDEQTVPLSYAKKVCDMIGKMGMRGISVLESSGDTGVGAGCRTNDGKNTPTFMPTFPGGCPYVTVVGGLQAVSPEVAWDASSGGFSNYFPTPSWQKDAIAAYIKTDSGAEKYKDYNGKYANFSGRGFPDVSAHSLTPDYAVIYNGAPSKSGGTSAAGPVFSSIIALLNDALLRAGKKQLGYLNPLLYSDGFADKALNDITGGAAIGCNGINLQSGQPVPGGAIIKGASWNATTGWDPSTGLGSPNFGKMKSVVLGG